MTKTFKEFTHVLSERSPQFLKKDSPKNILDIIKQKIDSGELTKGMDVYHFVSKDISVQELDEGLYSTVFKGVEGEDVVLKIATGLTDRWFEYAKVCIDSYNPMFVDIKYYHEFEDGTAIALTEYLEVHKTHENPVTGEHENILDAIVQKHAKVARTAFLVDFASVCRTFWRMVDGQSVSPRIEKMIDDVFEEIGINKEVFSDFVKKINHIVDIPDMHSSNIGFRKDGSPVWFDPV